MAELTYRTAVAHGLAQEMERDSSVVLLGEDIGAAGGVFKTTEGLLERFGPERVRDTPISEQAIVGAAMGAAMTGLRPVAELMFSDFTAVCLDQIANHAAKQRYMAGGATHCPLTIRVMMSGGIGGFGAQHSQSLEAWLLHTPGLKVAYPSTAAEAKGLLLSSIFDEDPVVHLESMALMFAGKQDVPTGDYGVTWRYTRDAAPMRATIVNGMPTFLDGRFTGAMPGEFVSPQPKALAQAAE